MLQATAYDRGLSCMHGVSWADPEGGQGVQNPASWKITCGYRFPYKFWYGPLPLKNKLGPFADNGHNKR